MTVPARRSLREGLPFHRDAEVGKVVRSTSSNIFGQSEKGIEYQHATDLPVHLRASAGRHAFRLILFLFDDKTKVDLVASRESNVPTQGLVELQGCRCAWIMRLYTERTSSKNGCTTVCRCQSTARGACDSCSRSEAQELYARYTAAPNRETRPA